MTSIELDSLPKKTLRPVVIIGWSFIIMFMLGVFAEFIVRVPLIKWDDSITTLVNIQGAPGLFQACIFAFIVIVFLDVILSVAFYTLFNPINKPVALLTVSLRLIYVAIKGSALVGLLLAKDIYASSIGVGEQQIAMYAEQGMHFLKLHQYGFGVGLIFFGFHLCFLALLLIQSNRIPKWILWFLLISGIGYIMNSLAGFFAGELKLLKNITIGLFVIPMTFAELTLGLWLWVNEKRL